MKTNIEASTVKKSKPTPSPWSVDITRLTGTIRVVGSLPGAKHCLEVATLAPLKGMTAANAKLIASAPELLEQLERLVGIICSLEGFEERDVTIEDCDDAKAVIAKAKGV